MTLAVCAVLAAVCVALNFVASLHIIRLDVVFYLLAGVPVYFASVRFGPGAGGALYAAAAILSFMIVPDKVWLLFFIGVFGPAAVLQSVLEKALGKRLAAVLSVACFIVLFYVFGVVVAYGGGFIPLIGLPEAGMPGNLILAIGFVAFSAVMAYIVNRGFYAMLSRRLGGVVMGGQGGFGEKRQAGKKYDASGSIVLPKLYDEDKK